MGVVASINYNNFPKQGEALGKNFYIIFNYNLENKLVGVCIRNDIEEPYETIFLLNDKRVIRDSECQYSPIYE